MADTTFVPGTVVASPWLNDINDAYYNYNQGGTGAVTRTSTLKIKDNISVFDYGAVGDGVTDDTDAINNFVAAGGFSFPGAGYTFAISKKINMSIDKKTYFGNGSIFTFLTYDDQGTGTLEAFRVTADDVEITGFTFLNGVATTETVYNSFIAVRSGTTRCKVSKCFFNDLVDGAGANFAVGFLTGTLDCSAIDNRFYNCPGAIFSQGLWTRIDNNSAYEPSDVSYVLNSTNCVGGSITNNKVYMTAGPCSVHIGLEEGASDWVVTGNYIKGINGAAISCLNVAVFTTVRGGVIANNILDGLSLVSVDPCLGIGWTQYYTHVDCHDNTIRNLPTGNSNSVACIISSSDSMFHHNDIDASGCGYAQVISIRSGSGTLDIESNKVVATGNSRAYVFSAENFASARITFRSGEIIGANEGINANFFTPTNVNLEIINHGNITSTNPLVLATAIPAWADWQTYFNAGAKTYPHWIKTLERTVMYGATVPAAGSGFDGGEIIRQAPTVGTSKGWRRVADAWVSVGNL